MQALQKAIEFADPVTEESCVTGIIISTSCFDQRFDYIRLPYPEMC